MGKGYRNGAGINGYVQGSVECEIGKVPSIVNVLAKYAICGGITRSENGKPRVNFYYPPHCQGSIRKGLTELGTWIVISISIQN